MQKEIQLTDKTLLVVGLPKEASNLVVDGNGSSTVRLSFYKSGWDWIPIPNGNYKLLGIYPELTEEQCAMVVDKVNDKMFIRYKDYTRRCKTAKESFQSLMEREKCYTVNPYAKAMKSNMVDSIEEAEFIQDMFNEALQRTFSKYAILIKSK